MKKQQRIIVIAAIALVAVVAAYFIISALLPKPEEEEDSKLYVHRKQRGYYNLVKVDYPGDDGYTYVIAAYTGDEGLEYTFADNGIYDGYRYSQTMMATALDKLIAIEANEVVQTGVSADDLSKYGLDAENAVRVNGQRINAEGDTEASMVYLIGGYNTVTSTYYVMMEGEEKVYSAASASVVTFVNGAKYFRSTDIIPTIGEDYSNLSSITWTKPQADGGETIRLELIDPDEETVEGELIYTTCRMTAPYTAYVNDEILFDYITGPIISAMVLQVVTDDPTDEQLESYGLLDPYIYTLESTNKKITLKVGTVGGSSTRYVMPEGENSVYLLMANMDGLALKPEDFRSNLVWLHNIRDVSKIDFTTPSGQYEYLIDDTTDNTTGTGAFVGVLNGKYIKDEDLGRDLFISAISLQYIDSDATAIAETTPSYVIKVTYRSGYNASISLYKVNSRQYAVVFGDGLPGDELTCVGVASVRNIDTQIQLVLNEK